MRWRRSPPNAILLFHTRARRGISTVVVGAQTILQSAQQFQRAQRVQLVPSVPQAESAISDADSALVAPAPILGETGKPNSSRVLQQYRELKNEYLGCIILMQVGDFFEVFDEDAERVSRALDIGLCNGRYKTQMTGFPIRNMESYLERLVKAGLPSVIVEQFDTGKMIRRQVTRIVTKGTLTEDSLLESGANNFILSIVQGALGSLGLAWIDLSTGFFRVLEIAKGDLPSELNRISPTELLVEASMETDESILKFMRLGRSVLASLKSVPDGSIIEEFLGAGSKDYIANNGLSKLEVDAASRMLQYVLETQIGKRPWIEPPTRYTKTAYMSIDSAALRSLEILKNNSTGSRENSLLSILDETCTAGGSRLLVQRLTSPLLSVAEINHRLDIVQFFMQNVELADAVHKELRNCRDLERSFQRLALGRNTGGPRDMVVIRQTLESARQLKALLRGQLPTDFAHLAAIDDCLELVEELRGALVDTPPSRVSDGGLIRNSYSKRLHELLQGTESLESRRDALVTMYRKQTGKSSLKLSNRKTLGLLVEVNKSEGPISDPMFILDSVLGEKFRYRTTELETLNTRFTSSGEDALREEMRVYEELRQKLVAHGQQIMATAKRIAEIDISTALATRARRRNYCRPTFTEGAEFFIESGRHPIVEERHIDEGRTFVHNHCSLTSSSRFVLITGPNMGGKSTFLRQNAIIAIMAQCGMFIPATQANLGIVDAVYTRIGASDDLSRDKSTFMVEMSETANILRHATDRSLVIMDEIGRGTSAREGMALARGICKFLYEKGCRTFFATHYTKLGSLRESMPQMQCLMTSAEFVDGDLCFLHQILPGIADRSHALEVARLAGLPMEVLAYSAKVVEAADSE